MKKKLLFMLMGLSALCIHASAQFVTLPDTNFRNHLMQFYPTCFNANLDLDTTCLPIVSAITLTINANNAITDISGVQYFDNLDTLNINNSSITKLPLLPNTLTFLNCQLNQLDTISNLPPNLSMLFCQTNLIAHIDNLPANLLELHCDYNQLSSLPALPNGLIKFYCTHNQFTNLPALPNSILDLNCSNNQLSTLPTLPSSLDRLVCDGNTISNFPVLPSTLTNFSCTWNGLTFLPSLPNSLVFINCAYNQLSSLPSLPPNLIQIYCRDNQLTSLPSLPSTLEYLDCSFNQLSTLPSLNASLKNLTCTQNYLSTLPSLPNSLLHLEAAENALGVLPTLPPFIEYLNCRYTNLTSLPALPNSLTYLNCAANTMSSLGVLPTMLTYLDCGLNSLTQLPTLPNSLTTLYCDANDLTNLPLLNSNLTQLYCWNNQLTSLPSLPASLVSLDCSQNMLLNCLPLLPQNLISLNASTTNITCVPNMTTNYQNWSMLPVCGGGSSCEPNPTASGIAFEDLNMNSTYEVGLDSVLRNWVITNSNGWTAMTNQNGEYYIKLDSGVNNSFQLNPLIPYCTIAPALYSITPTTSGSQGSNYNFIVQFTPGIQDMNVSVAAGAARPGFSQWVNVGVNNFGTIPMSNVTLKLLKPTSFVYSSSSPMISAQIGDTLIWNNINLSMFAQETFAVHWTLPPTTPLSLPYEIHAWVTPTGSDFTPLDNEYLFNDTVSGSYDPNDKTVSATALTAATLDKALIYTIRFQNTGTDTAFTVVVRDSLSQNLDWGSFKMLQASHSYQYSIREKGLLEVAFPNILLPDSNINEAASHGFFQYSIHPKSTMSMGGSILNTAYIYFDFNSPVITNTTVTSLNPEGLPVIPLWQGIIYPNPTSESITIEFAESVGQLKIFDMTGNMVFDQSIQSHTTVPIVNFANGNYICQLTTASGSKSIKLTIQR